MVTMISIGIIKPTSTWVAAKQTDLVTGFGAVTNMVFAYGEYNIAIYSVLGLTIDSQP
jgi:hypothetical protein